MSGAPAKKKKGLSLEEKIVLVERWITAHPQPYTLKELQQLIPKQTPVIYQSVEECVQLLVAENRIQQDRVGVSTLWWKFPLTATQKLQPACAAHRQGTHAERRGPLTYAGLLYRLLSDKALSSPDAVQQLCASTPSRELREWHAKLRAEHIKADHLIAEEQGRVGCSSEEALQGELARLQSLAAQRARLLATHKTLSSVQRLPELRLRLAQATTVAMAAANRWTDNYYLAEMEVVAKTGQSQRDVRAALQMPPAVDFISEDDVTDPEEEGGEKMGVGNAEMSSGNGCSTDTSSTAAAQHASEDQTTSELPAATTATTTKKSLEGVPDATLASIATKRAEVDPSAEDGDAATGEVALVASRAAGAGDTPPQAPQETTPEREGKAHKPPPKKRATRKRAR